MNRKRVIISGGGTGGHIFPAIAIANVLKEKVSNIEILFVGAQGKMEMEKVPAAGYKIIGLPVIGLQRKLSLSIVKTIIQLIKSLSMAKKVISNFNPDVVVGVGGYASGPVLRVAVKKKIPCLIQEQNSFAGITNKILGPKVDTICVAYEGMEKYFPEHKLVITGNPVRKDFLNLKDKKKEARKYFKINTRNVLFITGGSLGARSLNEAVLAKINDLKNENCHVLWQTGKLYLDEMKEKTRDKNLENIDLVDFVARMDLAYALADVVVCRAGALTCAELAVTGKPAILVPSPNVAEDHQTKNALAFAEKDAALMVKDSDAIEKMIPEAINLLNNLKKQDELRMNILMQACPDADNLIAREVITLMDLKKYRHKY